MGALDWLNETFREMGEFQREQRGLAILRDPSSFKSTGDRIKDVEILESYRIDSEDAWRIADKLEDERAAIRRAERSAEIWRTYDDFHARCNELQRKYGRGGMGCGCAAESGSAAKTTDQRQTEKVNGSNGKECDMAIRKPTAPSSRAADSAEMLASSGQETKFKNGMLVEGTVCAIKGNDVFVDIGYKSDGVIGLDEFASGVEGEVPAVKVGNKVTVMIVKLVDEKSGMVELSKKRADDRIRWKKILGLRERGVVTGTVKSVVRGGLLVQIDDVEAILPGSQIDVTPVKDFESYVGQSFKLKVIKVSNERRMLIVSRRALLPQDENLHGTWRGCKMILDGDSIVKFGSDRDAGIFYCHVSYLSAVIQALEDHHIPWFCFTDADLKPDSRSYVNKYGGGQQLNAYKALIGRYPDRFNHAPGGTQADDYILQKADVEDCDIVSDDNFQKPIYIQRYPWLKIKDENNKYLDVYHRVKSFSVVEGKMQIPGIGVMSEIREEKCGKNVSHPENATRKPIDEALNIATHDVEPNNLRVGGIVKGLVKNVQQYGAFVDLSGTTGFLYVGELRWTFTSDARDVVAAGQEITAKVIKIDRSVDPPRFNLSLRQLQPKPKMDSNPDSPQTVTDQVESSVIVSVGQAVPKDKDILIDGSNIVRWFPKLKSKALCMVMAGLEKAGYNAYIIFDSTIPHVLKETDDRVGQAFLDFLRESKPECVKIAPPDSQADDFILSYANAHGNHVISNDRFRQYVSCYPWVGNRNEQGRRVHRVEEIKGEIVLPTLGISVQSSGRAAVDVGLESLKIRWTKTSISPLRVEILQAFIRYLSGGDFVAVSQAEDEFFKASGIAIGDFIGCDLGQLLRMPIGRQFYDEQVMNGETAQHMVRSRLAEECLVDSERLRWLIDSVKGLVGSALPEEIQFDRIASTLQVKRCLILLAYVYAVKEGGVR